MIRNLIIILLIFPVIGLTQQKDAELWTGINIGKSLGERWKLAGRLESRFDENISELSNYFFSTGVEFEVNKYYETAVTYRLSRWAELPIHRFQWDHSFSYEFLRHEWYGRIRYQHEWSPIGPEDEKLRFMAGYRFSPVQKWRFGGDIEQFNQQELEGWLHNELRFTIDGRWEFKEDQFISAFYRYEIDQQVAEPGQRYIAGLSYKINL